MFEHDYILRMIEQVAQTVARAFGFIMQKQLEEAERQLDSGYGTLGLDRELLCVLDAQTIRKQFDHEETLAMAVRVLLCDAELQHQRSDSQNARRLLRAAEKVFGALASPHTDLANELRPATQRISH